jgi:tetratricopeptide (TPR) repeat protein
MLTTRASDVRLSPAMELRLWAAYGESLAMTAAPIDRGREVIQKVMDLVADVDDVDLRAGPLYLKWSVEFMSGHHGEALTSAHQLATVARQGGDAMKLTVDRILGASLFFAGRLAEAEEHLQRVVDFYVAPSEGHHSMLFRRDPQVLARVRLAPLLALRGHIDRAYAEAKAAFETARSSGAGVTVCWTIHDALCPIAVMRGDLDAAEAAVAAMSDWAAQMNATLWTVMATCWNGRLLIARGDFARGIELLSPTLETCEQSGWQMGYVQFLGSLAEGLARLGRLEEAGEKLERAIAWADHKKEGWYQAELTRMKGELLLLQPRADEAEECFRAAHEIAREQGALYWELRVALSLARLRISQGRQGEAKRLLIPVCDRFTEGFDTPDLGAARALLDD